MAKDPRLKRAGVSGYNKPKRTPSHPKKSHIVVAKDDGKIKAEGQYNKTATEMDDTVIFNTEADWNAYKVELDKLDWTNCTIEITAQGEVASVDDHAAVEHLTKY